MKLLAKFLIYFQLYLFILPIGVTQSTENDKQLLQEIDVFIVLSKDQINKERKVSDDHRESMLKLINELGYNEELILGADKEYWKEGLSEEFRSAPQTMQVQIQQRNQRTIQLENKHVELYESDRRLLLWENFKIQCEKIKDGGNTKFFRDMRKARIENPSYLPKNALLCYLLEKVTSKRKYPRDTDLLAKRSRRIGKYFQYSKTTDHTPLDSLIEKSYPYDGQVNFFVNEFKREYGYILLKNAYQNNYDSGLAVRWTDESGRTIDKEASYDYDVHAITFDLPKPFLQPGKIYKYQILSLPQKLDINRQCKSEVLDHTLTTVLADYIQEEKLEGKVIYEAHFRCSRYESFIRKIDGTTKQDHILNKDYKLIFNLNEPFADFELNGDDFFESQFLLSTRMNSNVIYPEGLYSIELKRILTTPKTLSVDTLDMSESMESLVRKYKEIKGIDEKKYGEVDYLKKLNLDKIELRGEEIYAITKDDFVNKTRFNKSYTYEVVFPMIDSLEQVYTKAQQALKDRINDRAEYFKLIDTKIKKMENDLIRHPIEYYLELEYAKLSDKMNRFLDAEMKLLGSGKCTLSLIYHLAGLEQRIAIHSLQYEISETK